MLPNRLWVQLAASFLLSLACACSTADKETPDPVPDTEDVDRAAILQEWLPGDYSNVAMAHDEEKLEIHIAKLPEFGHAFYIEEIVPGQTAPMRQYVWMIRPATVEEGGGMIAEHWRLTDAPARVGAWKSKEILQSVTMYTLRHAPDCDLHFQWDSSYFVGDSIGRSCAEAVPGALTCTTSMVLGPDGFSLRLMGFDARGKRIFGPSTHAWPWGEISDAWKFERMAAAP